MPYIKQTWVDGLNSTTPNGNSPNISAARMNYLEDGVAAAQAAADAAASTASTVTYGTVAGTAAAGNDPRIISALQPNRNLSDLLDRVVARANLGLDTILALLAPKANPTFTGTVTGVNKAHVGLGNADNTSDLAKPISTATATALAGKQPLVPVFKTQAAAQAAVAAGTVLEGQYVDIDPLAP